MNQPGISVIVPTYNAVGYLKECIRSLQNLDYPDFEVIVVNDASPDTTADYLATIEDPRFKIIHNSENLGTCLSRNLGIDAATHNLVAFIDHDCIADPNWLTQLARGFDSEKVGFVIGATFYVSKTFQGHFPDRLVQNPKATWPMGCNIMHRKEALEDVGGFDPLMFEYGNEDTDIALHEISRGWEYRSAPTAVVFHQRMFWTSSHLLRSAKFAGAWPILKKRYPRIYRRFKPYMIGGFLLLPKTAVQAVLWPIIIWPALTAFLLRGHRDLKVFFTWWPIYIYLKRWYIWKNALKYRVWMI